MQFVIPLSKHGEPLSRQIYRGLRQAILSGTFRARDRLPSTRDMAEALGVSRTVVLLAYDELVAEGFAAGRRGSGTYVPEGLGGRPKRPENSARLRLSRYGSAAEAVAASVDFPGRRSIPLRYDFAYGGRGDVEIFPYEMWRRILLRHARKAPIRELDYGVAAGSFALREAILIHLRRSRAVVCDPSQVIVVNGSQQALDLVARVLIERGDPVAIEDPQYQGAREIFRTAGARLKPVPVDRDGLNPGKLPKDARLALVTPSHQFPTGAILPLARRLALLDWARRRRAVVVEDDYDGEFRYEGQPLESLQGLDTEGRVIYVGTFSRTIFSALRIGYLIAPKSLVAAFTSAKWLCDRHTATLEQETLAEFISSGMYERHLRRVRRRNTGRRQALLEAIDKYLGGRVEVTGDGSGTHVVLWPRARISEEAAVNRAASRGVGIYGISRYFLTRPSRTGLMLGYSRLNEQKIQEGIRRLGDTL
ncbi:MAG TPA: PLP-dependent aminotransferase family protein [Terriglobia bacterium]|jgi:GntR family transcriptional regulator/MocR family aminotransferase|nr:PLP-dependent aminotransferase family protein [Terriglobia bacterium]